MDSFSLSLPSTHNAKTFLPPTSLTAALEISKKLKTQSGFQLKKLFCYPPPPSSSSSSFQCYLVPIQKMLPLAATISIILWSDPAKAGILSGIPGIESIPGPQIPRIEPLIRFNEENQKKYAEFDERFKSSPIVKELLERSKLNKEKNKEMIRNKYCLRGAEWGIGDCSTVGMTEEERSKFIAMLKQKVGVEN